MGFRSIKEKGRRACLASEGDHVVLAQAEDVDIAHDDHLLVVLGENGVPDYVWPGETWLEGRLQYWKRKGKTHLGDAPRSLSSSRGGLWRSVPGS